jgi:hypothetical protein
MATNSAAVSSMVSAVRNRSGQIQTVMTAAPPRTAAVIGSQRRVLSTEVTIVRPG